MKKHRWLAALAAMVMALAVVGCSDPSSGNESTTGSSGGSGNSSGTGNSGNESTTGSSGGSGNSSGIGNSGVDYSNCVVGDFVLKDGTILSKDEAPEKDTVAAVIVRAEADDKPALGVGIVHNRIGLAWCKESAEGYSTKKITDLIGDKTSGYMDGSDGWEKVKAACSDAEENPENYPAWNYSLTYAETNGLTGGLATGWYLPTVAELYTIYQNKTVVDASLSKAGGSQFGTSDYWSCCQSPSNVNFARVLNFTNGNMVTNLKFTDGNYVCSVRAFN